MGMDGLFDAIAGVPKAQNAEDAARRNRRFAANARSDNLGMVAGLDWEPELASDHIAPYKRTESPVARGFLESMVAGNNPAAVQGTRLGAGRERAAKQAAFNQQFGGFDALHARQREIEQETPWAVKPFEGPAITDADKDNVENSVSPTLKRLGYTPADLETLKKAGVEIDSGSGLARNPLNGKPLQPGPSIGMGMPPSLSAADNLRLARAMAANDQRLAEQIYWGRG